MIQEVKWLLEDGVSHERLQRYGLEYKWISRFILGEITYEEMIDRLTNDIARFAKRQMTFLRYMQKRGHQLIPIEEFSQLYDIVQDWLD